MDSALLASGGFSSPYKVRYNSKFRWKILSSLSLWTKRGPPTQPMCTPRYYSHRWRIDLEAWHRSPLREHGQYHFVIGPRKDKKKNTVQDWPCNSRLTIQSLTMCGQDSMILHPRARVHSVYHIFYKILKRINKIGFFFRRKKDGALRHVSK